MARLRGTLRESATIGVEQKRPDVHARCREVGGFGGDGEIACRAELTSGRRRASFDDRDDGLRAGDDGAHHRRAIAHRFTKESLAAVGIGAMRRHFLEIVPRRKDLAVGGENNARDRRLGAEAVDRGVQIANDGAREGVAPHRDD